MEHRCESGNIGSANYLRSALTQKGTEQIITAIAVQAAILATKSAVANAEASVRTQTPGSPSSPSETADANTNFTVPNTNPNNFAGAFQAGLRGIQFTVQASDPVLFAFSTSTIDSVTVNYKTQEVTIATKGAPKDPKGSSGNSGSGKGDKPSDKPSNGSSSSDDNDSEEDQGPLDTGSGPEPFDLSLYQELRSYNPM